MDAMPRSPSKPKQPNRNSQTTQHRSIQSMLRGDNPMSALFQAQLILFAEKVPIDTDESNGGERDANKDSKPWQTCLPNREAVHPFENNGKGIEQAEENGKDESNVKTEETHDGLCE